MKTCHIHLLHHEKESTFKSALEARELTSLPGSSSSEPIYETWLAAGNCIVTVSSVILCIATIETPIGDRARAQIKKDCPEKGLRSTKRDINITARATPVSFRLSF